MEFNLKEKLIDEVQKMEKKVETMKREAENNYQKIVDTEWKVKRSQFINFLDDSELNTYRKIMQNTTQKVSEAEESWYGDNHSLLMNQQFLQELKEKRQKLTFDLEEIKEISKMNDNAIAEGRNAVAILKKRNAAMALKLRKQKDDYESQMHKLQSVLKN